MKERALRLTLVTLAAAVWLSGCNPLNPRGAAPRPAQDAQLQSELETLKRENRDLKQMQREMVDKVDSLATHMQAEREENRRYRDMMATNFDLLEQSVALTLSKTAAQQPVVQPGELRLPAPSAAEPLPQERLVSVTPLAAPPAPVGGTDAMPQAGRPEPTAKMTTPPRGDAPMRTESLRPSRPTVALPVAMGITEATPVMERADAQEDPDLTPPSHPRTLASHRAAKALYDKGFYHFARREFDEAILIYRDFLGRYPADIYSDNAQFWIGEAYLQQERLDDAEEAFRRVLRDYEHRSTLEGFKTPDAIYRLGLTYLKRKDERRAAVYFTAVAERFPDTSAGRKARSQLGTLTLNTADTAEEATGRQTGS